MKNEEQSGFRKAVVADIDRIWEILQQAIRRRKEDGSNQWQDGYPNPDTIRQDIELDAGFVLTLGEEIVGYVSLMINGEPAYNDIRGTWKSDGDYLVFHRVAISADHVGKGLSYKLLKHIEDHARNQGVQSLRADTNFDNAAMLAVFERMGYMYCGEVSMRGSPRKAFEKPLSA